MPKITQVGAPSAANEALGGVPTLYYYDFASKGRGEVLRLFFEDAGIAFVDHRCVCRLVRETGADTVQVVRRLVRVTKEEADEE